MLHLSRMHRLALTGLLAGMVTALVLFALRGVLLGPRLVLFSPHADAEVPLAPLTVAGRAYQAHSLTLNGSPVLLDPQGYFTTSYDPAEGLNYLTFEVQDRIGRTRRLMVPLVATSKASYTPPYEQEDNKGAQGSSQENEQVSQNDEQ